MSDNVILGMGNAVLDVVVSSSNKDLDALTLEKGQMTIVDQDTSDKILSKFEAVKKSSGGSVANSIYGISYLGGDASFCGCVKNDELGKDFINDIKKSGANFLCYPTNEGPPTARCTIFVTEDGERTMVTFLGASVNLQKNNIKKEYFKNVSILIIEGYLWSSEVARESIKKAISFAKNFNIKVVFSLSDPGLVKSFKNDFIDFIYSDVDVLIGNYLEFQSLLEEKNERDLAIKLDELVELAVVTNGEKESRAFQNKEIFRCESLKNIKIIDTTGAGDMFAAGFFFKYNQKRNINECLSFATQTAAKIISQYGARFD
tara:strand:- start:1323 stop:2273 length:951 start_codon:yes stop_codon:yes gene_type:complete